MKRRAMMVTILLVGAGIGCNGSGNGNGSSAARPGSTSSPVTTGTSPAPRGVNPIAVTTTFTRTTPPTTTPPVTRPPTTAPTIPLPVTAKPTSRFAFTTAAGTNTVQAASIDPTTGLLTNAGASEATVQVAMEVVVHPSGKFAYTVGNLGVVIDQYSIDPVTGALTLVSNAVNMAGGFTGKLVFHPSGKFAYVSAGVGATGDVYGYTVDATTGALTPFANNPIGDPSDKTMAIDPAGRFLFCLGYFGAGGAIPGFISYTIDPTSGALTQAGQVPDYLWPQQLVCEPTGRFAYSADAGAGYIVVGKSPNSYAQGVVVEYVIDPVSGLQLNGKFNNNVNAGYQAQGLVVHPSGKCVYCINETSGDVYSYSIDQKTGLLTMIGSPLLTNSGAVNPTPATGPPAGFSGKTGPNWVTCDASGKFLYIANWTIDNVGIFTVDATTGLLTFSTTVNADLFPSCIATAP